MNFANGMALFFAGIIFIVLTMWFVGDFSIHQEYFEFLDLKEPLKIMIMMIVLAFLALIIFFLSWLILFLVFLLLSPIFKKLCSSKT